MLTLMNLSESLENCSRALMKVFDSESFNVNLPSVTDNLYLCFSAFYVEGSVEEPLFLFAMKV